MNEIYKILVVDDDPYILMSLEFLMKKNGYDVMVARNGTEALEILNTAIPDVVLLDIMMPDVNGYDICAHIKNSITLKNSKVIFMSAKTKDSDIKKPFSTRELVKDIKALLKN